MNRRHLLASFGVLGLGGLTSACQGGSNAPLEAANAAQAGEYRLGAGDQIRVIVFGQDTLSGDFSVDSGGRISMPLIGDVPAQGRTVRDLETAIAQRLSDGYVRDPRVSVQVATFRPFFVLGEVRNPGQFPYVQGMTALTAVAMAGGFTYRARQDYILITRGGGDGVERRAPVTVAVLPDDVVRIPERFF